MNITTEKGIEQVHKIRQGKILKELLDKDTSLLIEDPLENDMVLNMGPQHPATHGVLRVLLRLDGETVIKCVPELGYLHRGYEKLAENTTLHEFIPHTDRLDYLAPMSNNVGIALAIDNSLGIEAPPRAQWIRTLVAELARISSHLMAMGSTCMDVGALTLLLWTFTEREKLYDIFELICGARFTTSYTRIGGVANDIDDATIRKIKEWADQFPNELKYFEALVNRNKIFIDRMAGIGIMPPEKAIQLGLTGPTLRGSGIPRDLRRDNPYLVYDQLDFDVITFNDCDVLSRYKVRVEEMKQSLKIVNQIIDKMPQGEIHLKNPKYVLPRKKDIYTKMEELINDFMLINFGAAPKPGEYYTAIESPKGELGFLIVSTGEGHPWKLKIRSPSTSNLQGLSYMVEGSMIADVVAIIGSIDPIMGEADK
ncbi:MAG: NADH dehydrogenase (quinone) subunit D [Candidatus Kapabacteria bacterium]|nr:NADH dehydrogenase (quinone) subunit D [Candidatus Kapabacteria bacterium]